MPRTKAPTESAGNPRTPRRPPETSPEPFDAAEEYRRYTGREALPDALHGVLAAAIWAVDRWLAEAFRSLLEDVDKPLLKAGLAIPFRDIEPLPQWTNSALVYWAHQREHGIAPDIMEERIPTFQVLHDLLSDPPLRRSRMFLSVTRSLRILADGSHEDAHSILAEPVMDVARMATETLSGSPPTASMVPLDIVCTIINDAREWTAMIRLKSEAPKPEGGTPDMVCRAFYFGVAAALCPILGPKGLTGRHVALLAAAAGFEGVESSATLERSSRTWLNRMARCPSPASTPPASPVLPSPAT